MAETARILDLFQRPVDRRIEEVIKVDQTAEEDVYLELTEYVVTDAIRESFERILTEYQQMYSHPGEGIGIWISGFFGAGKSSFAKILGYILAGRLVKDRDAADIFCERLGPQGDKVRTLLHSIRQHIPTTAVIFDISTDRGIRSGSERITEVIYTALLRNLGYATDLDLAALEIALEAAGQLSEFERLYTERYGQAWRERRSLVAVALNQASAILHDMEPSTYPAADSWAKTQRTGDVSPNILAELTLELTRRRLGSRTVLFVIDEVGQYVSRSTDKMLDLSGVTQALGRAGKGKIWIAVTSQERLDEVVDSLEGKMVELARVQDRFPLRVDLAPSDISEVTSKRVLTKKPDCEPTLRALYERNKGTLASHSRPATSSRRIELDERRFVDLYPFLPYQIDLVIDVVSGLRNQPGASRQTGGANRTIIKLAQQALINPRVQLGAHLVGDLVTLDMLYDLVEGNVGYERRRDITEIETQFAGSPLVGKVAKAICLLQFVRGIPRSKENLASVLYPALGTESLVGQVEQAAHVLLEAQKIREGESGYELLSVQGKTWEEERRGIAPRPADLARMRKEYAAELLKDLKPYRYRGVRNFTPSVIIDGEAQPKGGDIPVHVRLADDADVATENAAAQDSSRQSKGSVFWVVPIGDSIYHGLQELHRSREMIARHERRITSAEEGKLLNDEKNRQGKILQGLRNDLSGAFLNGKLFFEGREYRAGDHGGDVSSVVAAVFADAVPRLFNRFDLGAVTVKGDEVKQLLTSTNLAGLSIVVYDVDGGLKLVRSAPSGHTLNPGAPIAQEIASFIAGKEQYGEPATGKLLESHFNGPPYGWDLDVVTLVVAALFRAGSIELISQGRTYRTWTDPNVQTVFGAMPRFRAAAFGQREGTTLDDLTNALVGLRDLYGYGDELAMDTAAIAGALRTRLQAEIPGLMGLAERLRAHGLPGWEGVDELRQGLAGLVGSPDDDDAVKTFAKQRGDIAGGLAQARALNTATTDANLATIADARRAVNELWAALRGRDDVAGALDVGATRLLEDLSADSWAERLTQIATDAAEIRNAYGRIYAAVEARHHEAYTKALHELESREEFAKLPEEALGRVVQHLRERRPATQGNVPPDLSRLEADLRLLPALKGDAILEMERLLAPEARVERVRASGFFEGAVSSIEDLEARIASLHDHCAKLLAEGARVVIE